MKRLLCIVGSMNRGGAETFLMKIYRNLDKSKYQMDFLVTVKDEGAYDKEIYSLGGHIHHIKRKTEDIVHFKKSVQNVIKSNNYKYVLRVSQNSLSALELKYAKQAGCDVCAFRSSNSNVCGNKFNALMHMLFKPLVNNVSDVKIAPSTEAYEFMFGKQKNDCYKNNLLKNGLNIDDFKFTQSIRNDYRDKLGLQDKFVIGHVGRFSKQKNHNFLIEVFSEIHKNHDNAVLMLIGEGELKLEIERKVKELNLQDSVMFMGVRNDVNKLLNAMDLFLFPSFFEGMPNTVIEAETNGLPCVISDSITHEAKVTDLVTFVSLDKSYKDWSNVCNSYIDSGVSKMDRSSYALEMKRKGYDIEDVTKRFVEMIFGE